MKIAEISIYPGRASKHVKASGVASYTKNLLKGIPFTKNDEVFVLCDKQDGLEETYQEDGFTIVRTFDRGTKFLFQLLRQIKKIKPDVIHIQQEVPLYGGIHTAYLLQWMIFALRKQNVAVTLHHVVNLHMINKKFVTENKSNAPAWMVKIAFQVIYKPLLRWAKAVLVHEQYFKDLLVDQYGVKAEKIHVVPHGVENFTPIATRDARQKLGIADDRHVALFMGYLAGYKGFDLLLEGFGEYVKQDPKAFLIIGAGKHPKFANDPAYIKEYEDMQQKAKQLIGEDQHTWIGFIDEGDIASYYSASDVSLYPYTISMSSSGPMSFAMGYEKPFLASDVFAKVLPANVIFERTPERLAEKLRDFFANAGAYDELSKNMKRDRLWTKVGQNTMNIYKEIAQREAK